MSEGGSDPKAAAGSKKPPVHLVPPALVIGAARALAEGAEKYGAYNWRATGVKSSVYIQGMLRHMMQYMDGEDVDPESLTGKTHLEGIAACVAIMLDAQALGKLVDDRPTSGPAPEMLRAPKP